MSDVKNIGQERINTLDYSKEPLSSKTYADMRGIVDWGNLLQFAPYESGYCFLTVINGPYIAYDENVKSTPGGERFNELQEAFIKILEQEFRGLSGIENITSETMEISDGITSISLLGKVTQSTNSQISMEFTEKSGTTITKYISTYLRYVRDPKTQAKTYGGAITASTAYDACLAKEVFNLLYVITDNTCMNIEKAFLLLNAQPTEADYSSLYNFNKGEISTKDISVNFNAFVVDGVLPNKLALAYMRSLVNAGEFEKGKINTNSYEMDWSISGPNGKVGNVSELVLEKTDDNYKLVFQEDATGNYIVPSTALGKPEANTWQKYEGLK